MRFFGKFVHDKLNIFDPPFKEDAKCFTNLKSQINYAENIILIFEYIQY